MAAADADTPKKAGGGGGGSARKFQAPKGTRDFYPEDMLRKRYLVETWRAVSLRHGFEEIDGPTFEHLDLYTVKSGEGIVSELFSFRREGGEDTYALRPEFTPTLARMYAARAAQLPKPVRWFCVPSFFRAERPQRGRLREFLQWNCDVIGGGGELNAEGAEHAEADGEIVGVCVGALEGMGLRPADARVRFGSRQWMESFFDRIALEESVRAAAFALLDKRGKVEPAALREMAIRAAITNGTFLDYLCRPIEPKATRQVELTSDQKVSIRTTGGSIEMESVVAQQERLLDRYAGEWAVFDASIVRGLAYYTGMVFEVIAEGERAVAGGGRYDNLIELLGGPPTPAVGFAMGDVVLGNLLEDKGLMPRGAELAGAVEAVVRSQRIRPEVLVTGNGDEAVTPMVTPLVARLRRGIEAEGFAGKPWELAARYDGAGNGVRPVHVRTSTKNPKRLNKVLEDAEKQGARYAAIIHGEDKVQVRDMDRREDVRADLHVDPASGDRYVGRVLAGLLG